jgi:hypothetical protein
MVYVYRDQSALHFGVDFKRIMDNKKVNIDNNYGDYR